MLKNPKNLLLIFSIFTIILAGASIYSYFGFTTFKPEINFEKKEVKGAKSLFETDFPLPEESTIIGVDTTDGNKKITFETSLSSTAVQNFYKNILTNEKWEITSEGRDIMFLNSEYKKDSGKIQIISSKQQNSTSTIVSIDIINP